MSTQTNNGGWYERVEHTEALSQGDILLQCPVLTWKTTPVDHSGGLPSLAAAVAMDLIVMTQACDLMQEKVTDVVLCATSPLQDYQESWKKGMSQLGQNPTDNAWKKHLKDIGDGFLWGQALLNWGEVDGLATPLRIVYLNRMHTLPLTFLKHNMAEQEQPRLRLRPPYREHLAQAFARLFMRVGLPTSVDFTGPYMQAE